VSSVEPPPAPPRDLPDLLRRAHTLAGRTVGELAGMQGVDVPEDPRRAKGLVGRLVERALGAPGDARAGPDLATLGVEIKTIPLDLQGRPRESTFVCHLPLRTIATLDWDASPVRHKLQRVLWVPVEHDPDRPLAQRRIGAPVLWSPSEAEHRLLAADWEEIAGRIGAGDVEAVTAHDGVVLQVRPKGRSSLEAGRGFYLRARFTADVLRRARQRP
jgi:DNA mismatch repair protein MutH